MEQSIKFRGKIDWWFYLTIIVINGVGIASVYSSMVDGASIGFILFIVFSTLGLGNVIVLPMVVTNYVFLEGDCLTIYLGFFKETFNVSEIIEIKTSHCVLASMAASLDRIYIRSNKNATYVAVKDKKAFFEEIYKRNRKLQNK